MRRNEPVTQREYVLESGTHLVSTTDPQGRILYCNPAFVEVSGFAREELLGQAHNIVRHPDMPEEAFRDMWETLKRGQPWSGLVKNRRKTGDHYWVQANVTPIVDGDACIGYMSVRTPARRDAIEAAEKIYARLSEQERSAAPVLWRIVGGRAERVDLRGALSRGASRIADHRLTIAPLLLAGASWLLGQWGGPMHLGLALALAVALATAAQLRRAIEWPLLRLLASAERIAAGDLTQHMECGRSDTVGRVERALHQMNVNLQSIIGDARREVEQMNHALAELAAGNQDMSVRTESQASSVQETAASMEELTTTVGSNTASARDAAMLADDTAIVSGDGAQAVAGVRASMLSIDASSRRIADITQVIDTISFQTNILALNAAVEAARAGEQGRGFAVVASEVRALSNRTTEAAKQIKVLIEDSKTTVADGVQQAQRASDLMDRGLVSVRKVSEFMRKIQQASDEQQLGISQACQAVAQLDGITQQNAAMVEELSACASALRGRAGILNSSMQVFRLANEVRPAPDAARLRRESRDASRARQPISA